MIIRNDIPLHDLGLGEDPVVDLRLLAKFLAYWEVRERKSAYNDDKEVLRLLSVTSRALAATMTQAAKSVDPEAYRKIYNDLDEYDQVAETQQRLEASALESAEP